MLITINFTIGIRTWDFQNFTILEKKKTIRFARIVIFLNQLLQYFYSSTFHIINRKSSFFFRNSVYEKRFY